MVSSSNFFSLSVAKQREHEGTQTPHRVMKSDCTAISFISHFWDSPIIFLNSECLKSSWKVVKCWKNVQKKTCFMHTKHTCFRACTPFLFEVKFECAVRLCAKGRKAVRPFERTCLIWRLFWAKGRIAVSPFGQPRGSQNKSIRQT